MTVDANGLVVEIERDFTVSRERLFTRWTDPAALARWFAPPEYRTLSAEVDPRPGGSWRLTYRSKTGHEYAEQGVFQRIDAPRYLEFTLTQVDGAHDNPHTVVAVDFEDVGTPEAPLTRMRFTQRGYRSADHRDDNAEGWDQCLTNLGRDLDSESPESVHPAELPEVRELRRLFSDWFDAAERKDVDASMAPISEDIVSYEHEVPMEYRGRDSVREVCAGGYEYQRGEFRWDIPDLQIRVSGGLAVTWGLNRMRTVEPDGAVREAWSRGTRIFENRDGGWKLIHQHVSFPVTTDGQASMSR